MRHRRRAAACLLFFGLRWAAVAQEPALPSTAESPAPLGTPVAVPSPPPLLPTPLPTLAPAPLATIPAAPDLSLLDAGFKKTPMGQVAEEYRQRVEVRKLENVVLSDSSVIEAKKYANSARTDLEKRKRLRLYYALLYTRMRALAPTPELKGYVDAQKSAHLSTTAQDRVRPGGTPAPKGATPPPATPIPTASPTPSPFR